jgi:hypothetical protein
MSDIEEYQDELPLDLAAAWDNPSQYATAVVDEAGVEKEKERLIGVPFAITKVTYHSDFKKSDRGYVTLEGFIAPMHALQEAVSRGWIPDVSSVSELLYKPGEKIKINDGSTGIRRDVTQILHNCGSIDVGTVTERADFDRSWTEWNGWDGTQTAEENGAKDPKTKEVEKIAIPCITRNAKTGKPLLILATHGLRASYMEDYETTVYYLS